MATALAGAFAGGMGIFAVMSCGGHKNFFAPFGFSLFAASVLWIAPAAATLESRTAGLCACALMVLFLPLIKYSFCAGWKTSALAWTAFLLSQAAVFLGVYYLLK